MQTLPSSWIFIGSIVFCLFNVGLIWTIQVVHYPGFLYLSTDQYKVYQAFHMSAITKIVGITMVAELIFAFLQVLYPIPHSGYVPLVALVLLVVIFIHTAFVASPIHIQLTSGFNDLLIRKLISYNWIRTVLWSIRGVLLILLLVRILKN